MYISEPLASMTPMPVHHLSYLATFLVCTNKCIPGTPHMSCLFGDALTQSSTNHYLALVRVTHLVPTRTTVPEEISASTIAPPVAILSMQSILALDCKLHSDMFQNKRTHGTERLFQVNSNWFSDLSFSENKITYIQP